MSASREKKIRQESGSASIKAQREAEALKKQKSSNAMYIAIAVIFVVVAAVVIVWNSNIIQKNATAAVIDGEEYTADELSYYYHYAFNEFTSNYGDYISYLGLDTSISLKEQESVYGGTWDEYFKEQAIENLKFTTIMCDAANAAGYELTQDDEIQINNEISYTKFYAETNNMSYDSYVKAVYGSLVSTKLFERCLRESTLADSYANSIFQSYSYTDDEIDTYLAEHTREFQLVSYEYFTSASELEEGADAPTDEAKAAAKAVAEEIKDKVDAGEELESVAKNYEDKGAYTAATVIPYTESELNDWLFDDSRKEGDTMVQESLNDYLTIVFHERYLEDYNTVDAHLIRMSPSTADLDSESDTYADDLAKRMEETKAKAEEVLQTWKDGEASKESFIELANKHSNEGIPDGEYTQIYKGYLGNTIVDEWLFDEERKSGDVELLEGEDSVYILYFDGENRPYVDIQVENTLRTNEYNAYYEETMGAVESSESSGMKYVG